MAMEGTHIRFALDLQDTLQPTDLHAYIAGSVYPDSRYVSGIDRIASHPKDYSDDPFFTSSDFHKGWFAHLLCDEIQWDVMRKTLPSIYSNADGHGSETWVNRTAIKVLQDIEDIQKFDLAAHLAALSHIECPNGESEEVIRSFHELIQKTYARTPHLTIEDGLIIWAGFNIGDELVQAIREKAYTYASDPEIMEATKTLYDAMLSRAKSCTSH